VLAPLWERVHWACRRVGVLQFPEGTLLFSQKTISGPASVEPPIFIVVQECILALFENKNRNESGGTQ
jgi:hypothetical protein